MAITYDKKTHTLCGVRAAIFDLDGTLFDSISVWEKIDTDYLKKRGLEPNDEYRAAISALGNLEVAKFSVEYYKLDEQPEALAAEWTAMAIRAYSTTVGLLAGAREYVHNAHARGIKIYAVTSLDKALALPCLKNNGIFELFDGVLTADECGLNKSSPEMYAYAASCAGERPSVCVVFDDVSKAIAAAKSAGMTTVAITGADYYGKHDGSADFEVKSLAHAPRLKP